MRTKDNKLTGYDGSVLAFIARFRQSEDAIELAHTLKGPARRIAIDLLREKPRLKVSKAIMKWALPNETCDSD